MIKGVIWSRTLILLRHFQFAIERFHPRGDAAPAAALAHVAAAGLPLRRGLRVIFRQPVDGGAKRWRVAADDEPTAGFFDDFGRANFRGDDDRQAALHGFQDYAAA